MKKPLIDINHVSLRMPHVDHPLLFDITYQIYQGDFVVILGSNGSGKSTLLKLLDRRYSFTSGTLAIKEKSVTDYTNRELSHTVMTLTQNCHESLFTSLTLFENYLLVKHKKRHGLFPARARKERDFFADYIGAFNKNLSRKLDTLVDRLSGGEKQALALALIVLDPPTILLLDEHTSALDPNMAAQLMQLTYQCAMRNNITCLLTTHNLEVAKNYGNRVLALRQGKIYQSIETEEKSLLTAQHLLEACY